MNSKRLKELHPEVYKKFFTENELVLSMPLSMDWTVSGFLSGDYQGVHLRQKLPLRVYVGISQVAKGKGLIFNKMASYDAESNIFFEEDMRGGLQDEQSFFSKLTVFLNSECGVSQGAFSINLLTEASVKLDLGAGPVMCLLTLFAVLSYGDSDFMLEMVRNTKNQLNSTYYDDPFGEHFRKTLLFYQRSWGTFPYLSMMAGFFLGAHPFVGYRAPVSSKKPEDRIKFFGLKNSNISVADEIESFNLVDQSSSFDLVAIYSGIPIVPHKYSLTSTYSERITKIKQMMHQKLVESKSLSNLDVTGFDGFFSHSVGNMDEIFTRITETVNLEIRYILLDLSTNRFYIDALERLCAVVNKVLPLFRAVDYYSKSYIAIIEYMNRFLGNTTVGVFPFDITSGGGVISIISPLESNRKKVHQMVDEYRQLHPDSQMSIIYESRKDGYEYEGVKIEQDIRSGLFSDFIERGNCMIQHYDGSTQLIEYSQLALQTYDDIIVDTIHHKIYLPGHKLTSKDLHTQTSTSEILEIALQQLDTDIPNTKLPVGAYAKNKNDMTAKIIIPLKKLIEKYCDKDLMFTCSGSLSSFTIRLSTGKVRFGIVKPLA